MVRIMREMNKHDYLIVCVATTLRNLSSTLPMNEQCRMTDSCLTATRRFFPPFGLIESAPSGPSNAILLRI